MPTTSLAAWGSNLLDTQSPSPRRLSPWHATSSSCALPACGARAGPTGGKHHFGAYCQADAAYRTAKGCASCVENCQHSFSVAEGLLSVIVKVHLL